MSESDVYRCQILTYKHSSRAVRAKLWVAVVRDNFQVVENSNQMTRHGCLNPNPITPNPPESARGRFS